MTGRVVSFPHMGNYHVATRTAARLFGDEVIVPPKITRQTLELGAKHSPESACIPFKYTLGNFIEALELGANVLVQAGGGCRMGFYGEVQQAILRKLGYKFEFVKLINDHNIFKIARQIKRINPHLSYLEIGKGLYLAYAQAKAIDDIEAIMRVNIGFETKPGAHERLLGAFLSALSRAQTVSQVRNLKQDFEARFLALEIRKPARLLRVGVVGEIYVVMEPFSNFFVEKELAQYGIEVHRFMTISGIISHGLAYKKYTQRQIERAQPYLMNAVGAHGTESVAVAHMLAQQGFDGLIHVKPFGCMPEVNAMPALHHISRDYNFPIIYFSFDVLTSETGIKTRLEAFYDMLAMKEENHVPL